VLADLQAIQGSGKHHGPIRHYKALLQADSYKVGWASFQQECSVEGYRNFPQPDWIRVGGFPKCENGLLRVGIQRIEADSSCQKYWSESTPRR
jgi:hypothetical protein